MRWLEYRKSMKKMDVKSNFETIEMEMGFIIWFSQDHTDLNLIRINRMFLLFMIYGRDDSMEKND